MKSRLRDSEFFQDGVQRTFEDVCTRDRRTIACLKDSPTPSITEVLLQKIGKTGVKCFNCYSVKYR